MCKKKQDMPIRNILKLDDEDDVRPVRSIFVLDDEEMEEPNTVEKQQAGYLERYAEDGEGYVPIRPGRMYLTAEQIEEILQQREQQEQKWKVSARTGSGSFGTVYDVEVTRLGIPSRYSLKVSDATGNMVRELEGDSDEVYERCREEKERKYLERSRNEAALMRAFHDVPQIVNLAESWEMTRKDSEGVEHRLSFLLMDRWDGDLTDFTGKKMDQAAGLQLGTDLMSALSEMKSRPLYGVSVAHRDMRCENILYRSEKNVCGYRFALADFGIAKLDPPSGRRRDSIIPNIEDFLPPGEKYTWRSDVYLAGMAIYRFLSGWDWGQMELAFRPDLLRFDENGLIMLRRPVSIRNSQFWDLLKQMMQKDAKKRMEPAAALKEFERLRREDASEKKSRFLLLATACAAVVVSLAILLTWRLRQPDGNGNGIVTQTRVEDLEGVEIPLETAGTKDDVLEEIRQDMTLGNYDGALERAEQYGLTETEEILNLQGILYAAGLGREVDLEQAIRYFEAACLQGQDSTGADSDTQRAVSFRNLFLAALCADLEDMAEEGTEASVQMPHTAEALRFGELLGNKEAERILQERMFAVRGVLPEAGENIFDSFWEMENRPEILKEGIVEQEPYRYLVASDYDYIITQYENGEVDVEAIVVQMIERELPIRVMKGIYPDTYETFYGESIEQAAENAIDIAVYDYPSTYIDENGNEQYWKDTEEIFYGEIPPEDTEDTRWMINGYDENGGRKFRKQIK